MGKANRSTLKNFFQRGHMPSERQFADLIDSMLNMVDEGFDKSPEDGLKISQLGENAALISFYHPTDLRRPTWIITCDKAKGQHKGRKEPVHGDNGIGHAGQSHMQYPSFHGAQLTVETHSDLIQIRGSLAE